MTSTASKACAADLKEEQDENKRNITLTCQNLCGDATTSFEFRIILKIPVARTTFAPIQSTNNKLFVQSSNENKTPSALCNETNTSTQPRPYVFLAHIKYFIHINDTDMLSKYLSIL